MDAAQTAIHNKLKQVREKEGSTLSTPPNLRSTITKRDGSTVPLVLRNYQLQMVVHLLALHRFVVGDDTGLGKTVETIAALCHLWAKNPDQKVGVLTKKSSVPQWVGEFERFTEGVTVLVAKGSPRKRGAVHEAWEEATGPTVLVQGYSSACNDFSRLQHWEGHVLVMDEVTVCKNPSTRTQ